MPTLKKVVLTADRTTIPVGESSLLTATAYDAAGARLAASIMFGQSDPDKGTLTPTGHAGETKVTANAPGYFTVDATAVYGGKKLTKPLRLTFKDAPPPPPPPPPPPSATAIAMLLERDGAGTATTICEGWAPLLDGELTPAQFAAGRGVARIAGVEIVIGALAPTDPGTRYPSGCLRFLIVQRAQMLTAGTPLLATFDPTATRTLALSPLAEPDAVDGSWLATDPARLCATGLFGTILPRSVTLGDPAAPDWLAPAEALFVSAEATIARPWGGGLDGIGTGTRYDHERLELTQYARTGDTSYARVARRQWRTWRRDYLLTPNGEPAAAAEPYVSPIGWTLAAWLWRDELARGLVSRAVVPAAAKFGDAPGDVYRLAGTACNEGSGRFGARAVQARLWARQLGVTLPWNGGDPLTDADLRVLIGRVLNEPGAVLAAGTPAWTATLAGAVPTGPPNAPADVVATYAALAAAGAGVLRAADGYVTFAQCYADQNGPLPYVLPFQAAIWLRDVLIPYHDHDTIEPLAAIRARVGQFWRWAWDRCRPTPRPGWTGERLAYSSLGAADAPLELQAPSADTMGFLRGIPWWLAREAATAGDVAGARVLLAQGDALARSLLGAPDGKDGPFLTPGYPKQFAEAFERWGDDLGLRAQAVAAIAAAA